MSRAATIRRTLCRIFGIILLAAQGAILDFYLVAGNSNKSSWIAWVVTDIIVLLVWTFTMVKSHKRLKKNIAIQKEDDGQLLKDELAYAYLAWIVYALHLVPQAAVIMKLIAHKLDEGTMFFGPNLLKMDFCLTPVLFLFLVFAHHDAKPNSRRKFYLEKLLGMVTLDLFDSVEMLEYLFDKDAIPPSIHNAILVFASINFLLPTLALYELKHNKFHDSGEVSPVSFKLLYICIFLLFVNIPFLVIRLILWHKYHLDISVLLAKNGLGIMLGILEIGEFIGEQRPKRCNTCSKTFIKEFYKPHRENCAKEENSSKNGRCKEESNGRISYQLETFV